MARLIQTERQRIQHLLRRAGFGYSLTDLNDYVNIGWEASVNKLVDYSESNDRMTINVVGEKPGDVPFDRIPTHQSFRIRQIWNLRLINSPWPLQEKMTYFWHDHFATELSKVGFAQLLHDQNQLFRDHALGNFYDLLLGVTRDGAMLKYLDNRLNRRGKPNENYARELLELFTLGEGVKYSEVDVAEGARALTGWQLPHRKDKNGKLEPSEVVFNRRLHDSGLKSFLGENGYLRDESLVRILHELPETADFIGRKLWIFFSGTNPTPEQLKATTGSYIDSDGSIKEIVRTILLSDEMYSDQAYRSRIKSPVEFVVGSVRALEMKTSGLAEISEMRSMGQNLYDPPSVAGWAGEQDWINGNSVIARANFANSITQKKIRNSKIRSIDIPNLFASYGADGTASDAVEFLVDLLVGGDVDQETRKILEEHIGGKYHYNFDQASSSGTLNNLVYLAMTMPVYHLS